MGDSDDSVFCWDEKEDDYAGFFTSQDFQIQANHTSNYDEDSSSKMISLSSDSHHQEGEEDSSSSNSSPLGLTLRKTPSFLSLLQRSLSKGKHVNPGSPEKEKLKASNFPALYIKIGTWERITRHEGDLTAKLYYAKRKLVWEVLDGALKSKIEMQWSDISALRAITPANLPGTLEIELNQPPLFYREINPQPRKHTLWQQASDFTGGQAPIWRRHHVRFPPGVLDRHYEKLLQCDPRLSALNEKPFPSCESPYFDPTMFGISQLSLIFNNYQYPYQNQYQQQHQHQGYPPPSTTVPPAMDLGPASWTSHQPNVGMGMGMDVIGAGSSNYEALDTTNHYIATTDHSTPNINPQPHYENSMWMPSQHTNAHNNINDDQNLLMEQQFINNSFPPYFLPGDNSTTGHFF